MIPSQVACKCSVPMLCPSNGDVLARALVNKDGMISSQVAYAISFKELVKTTLLQPWYDFITGCLVSKNHLSTRLACFHLRLLMQLV